MKKCINLFVVLMVLLLCTACSLFDPEVKEFSGSGITVTLDESFVEGSAVNAKLYLQSQNILFIGNSELKTDLSAYGFTTHTALEYCNFVLKANEKAENGANYSDENTSFAYGTYTAFVNEDNFSYLLVTLIGEEKCYAINFCCKSEMYSEYEEQFLEWAKTIRVE